MAVVYGSARNGTFPPFLGLDADSYWNDLADNHRAHIRQARTLTVVIAVLVLLAVLVHLAFIGIAAVLTFFLALTLVMIVRSRPTGDLPDQPRSTKAEIER